MLSMDALDLSLSNLIQIVKMRTSAGFIPSYAAGVHILTSSHYSHALTPSHFDVLLLWMVGLYKVDILAT